MPDDIEDSRKPDWAGIARAHGLGISEGEIEQLASVLEPLVSECRQSFDEDLYTEHPIGTFRVAEP